jgi:hypothetical protein
MEPRRLCTLVPVDPSAPFVPEGFVPPGGLVTDAFVLEPLGPRHNEADYAAWTSSIPHIQATPGFAGGSWPHEMTLAENLGDLEMHDRHFAERSGFTYSVLDPADGDVIGCVYIYPQRSTDDGDARSPIAGAASVLSWVRAGRADLDVPLWRAVSAWLEAEWPFDHVVYAPRAA